jgi:hypothetical protein
VLTLKDYLRLNGKYLKDAEELLAKGDYTQASEKFWGAAAEMVKAVAAKHGVRLGTYKSIVRYVLEVDKKHPEWRLQEAFAQAETLHVNFYEDNLPEEVVKVRAETVKRIIEKLKPMLE